jgi:AcrR family transcriptional regulator
MSARTRRTTERKSDIVIAAAELFGERGFADVGMQEIAERVGVTAGALYRHFPSKDAVLEAVLADAVGAFLQAAEFHASVDATELPVRAVLRESAQLVLERPAEVATYVRERHRTAGRVRSDLERREAMLFRRWSDVLLASQPGLSMSDIVIRQQALFGVLSSLALRSGGLAQPRMRTAVNDGLVALATAEPLTSVPDALPSVRTWQPPAPRREQIITAAVRLFAAHGYHGVTMDDIGDALGMSGPSLYEHFSGKADILVDAFDRAGAYVIAGASRALASATSAADAVDRLITSYVTVVFDHVDLCVVTSREGAALPPSEQPRLVRQRRDLHEQWSVLLREIRSDLSPSDARALTRSSVALILAIARGRRRGSPSVNATVALAHAFLFGRPSQQPGGNDRER